MCELYMVHFSSVVDMNGNVNEKALGQISCWLSRRSRADFSRSVIGVLNLHVKFLAAFCLVLNQCNSIFISNT